MISYLERYDAGDMRAVWHELHAIDSLRYRNERVREDVAAVADRTIERATENLRTIYARLCDVGYVFDLPEFSLAPIDDSRVSAIASLVEHVGVLPPTLASALQRIGDVSFRGSLPAFGSVTSWREQLVDPFEFFLDLQADIDQYEDAATFDESDFGKERRFRLGFAGDYLHKNNVSGGQQSQFLLPSDTADVLLLEDDGVAFKAHLDWLLGGRRSPRPLRPPDQPIWFVDYLRMYFDGGGFRRVRGTASYPEAFAQTLATGLLEI